MNERAAPFDSPQAEPAAVTPRSRAALLKRLADVVSLPASRINAFERAMTADLLVEMLRDAITVEREKVARRLANLTEMPGVLVRMLLRDELPVARALLENSPTLSDADLISCLYHASLEHRRIRRCRDDQAAHVELQHRHCRRWHQVAGGGHRPRARIATSDDARRRRPSPGLTTSKPYAM